MTHDETPGETPAPPWHKRPSGILFLHFLFTAVIGLFAAPVAVSFFMATENAATALPPALLSGVGLGWLAAARRDLPPTIRGRCLMPLAFVWALFFGFAPAIFFVAFGALEMDAVRFVPVVYVAGLFAAFIFREQKRPDRVVPPIAAHLVLAAVLLLPAAHMGYGLYSDAAYKKKRGHGFERVGGFSSTDLKPYDPRVPDAVTPRLAGPPTFTIRDAETLPVLDGAEAAFPVYAAFAGACYPDLPPLTPAELDRYDYRKPDEGALTFTNTVYGFNRLLEGKVDIFFGAHPSGGQMAQAAKAGKELALTPVAKEAFVFFVNEANPLNGLTSEQLRDIYSGTIRNWAEVGGAKEAISAFQRPENSGSQSIMTRFMGDIPLENPLQDRVIGPMGGSVDRVAEYRNAPSALGYSFRFFLTGMGKKPHIKMLALDGVPPTPETFASGAYPHVVFLYAITVKGNPNPGIPPFLEWMQGPEGQDLVEKVGYSRLQ